MRTEPRRTAALDCDVVAELAASTGQAATAAWECMQRMAAINDLCDHTAEDSRTSVRWIVAMLHDATVKNTGLAPSQLERLEAIGAGRALQGVPLDLLRGGLRAAFDHSANRLVTLGEQRDDDGRQAVVAALGVFFTLFVEALSALTIGYYTLGSDAEDDVRQVADFAEAVLDRSTPEHRLRTLAAGFGIDGTGSHGLVVVVPCPRSAVHVNGAATADLECAVDAMTEALPAAIRGPVRSTPSPHAVVLVGTLDASARSALQAVTDDQDVLAVVTSSRQWRPLGARYRRMRPYVHAVALHRLPGVVPYDILAVYEVLSPRCRDPFVAAFAGALAKLPAPDVADCVRVLRALQHTHGYPMAAATILQMDQGSVERHMRRVRAMTGLDPRRRADLRRLVLACDLLHHHGDVPDNNER